MTIAPEIEELALTYSMQKIFEKYTNQNIIFEGYLGDLEVLDNKVVGEFIVPLGSPILDKEEILFRLNIPEDKVAIFLEKKRVSQRFSSIRFFDKGDFEIIARIRNLKKIPTYRINGTIEHDSVKLDERVSRRLIAVGHLIEAFPIQKP